MFDILAITILVRRNVGSLHTTQAYVRNWSGSWWFSWISVIYVWVMYGRPRTDNVVYQFILVYVNCKVTQGSMSAIYYGNIKVYKCQSVCMWGSFEQMDASQQWLVRQPLMHMTTFQGLWCLVMLINVNHDSIIRIQVMYQACMRRLLIFVVFNKIYVRSLMKLRNTNIS